MLNALIFNPNVEGRDVYLTRMSKVVDSIRNGIEVDEVNYQKLLSKEEMEEFKNYLFEVMLPIIKKEGQYYVKKNKLNRIKDDYMNQLFLEVWNNFHKYNNDAYTSLVDTCAFSTFVKVYTRDPARKVINSEEGRSKYVGYKMNMINKTIRYMTEQLGVNPDEITPEDIQMFMPNVSTLELSLNDIISTINHMNYRVQLEDYMETENPEDNLDEMVISNENGKNTFKVFINALRPMQRFIFCQSFGFCSDKYDDISLNQLVCDPDFLKIVKGDHIGAKHITKGNVFIEKPRVNGFEVKDGPWELANVEHIDVNFVTHQRVRCNKLIVKFVQENELDEYDVKANLAELLREVWAELSDEFGLE